MADATPADADVVLRLYELRREPVMRQAREWFVFQFEAATYADQQRLCPRGSDNNRYYRMVVSYWNMAAAIVLSGAVHEELFFETNGECMAVWRKIAPWIGEAREARGDSRYLRHIEDLGTRWERYLATSGD